jgi:hypothetical protein
MNSDFNFGRVFHSGLHNAEKGTQTPRNYKIVLTKENFRRILLLAGVER